MTEVAGKAAYDGSPADGAAPREACLRDGLILAPKAAPVVLDPFLGGGGILEWARLRGFPAIGIEIEERYCEIAARRLSQGDLFSGQAS